MTYQMPYVGCMIGTAFQKLTGQLDIALNEVGLDLTTPEYMVLRALYTRDGLQQCEIGDMVGKDKGAVSRTVKNLSAKNLVRTETLSHKCCRVWLTETAHKIKPTIMEVATARHKAFERLATPEDVEAFVRVLQAIINDK